MKGAARIVAGVGLALLLGVALFVGSMWNDRVDPARLGIPESEAASPESSLRLTWLGVTSLLIDDGETRLLTDGFFSRPGVLAVALDRSVAPDREGIEAALARFDLRELAAVIPVHSHYDHAMDAGEVALRTGARVLGSESTANAARGAGLPEARIDVLGDGESRRFGRFVVTLHASRHWPAQADGSPPMPGVIESPLFPPAPVSAWREGGSWSIHVAHPEGNVLVQGSAGFVEGALAGVEADLVVLGVGGLSQSGRDHAARYWAEVVERSGAARVLLVHWDDFTRPYGEILPFPRRLDDLAETVGWLSDFATEAKVRLELPRFGVPLAVRPR